MFETVFKIRVVYKSGYTHDFECTDFSISTKEITWKGAANTNMPVKFGIDDVAAVWQVGYRKRLKFFRK